jgi:uncharacterized membrane protein YccC
MSKSLACSIARTHLVNCSWEARRARIRNGARTPPHAVAMSTDTRPSMQASRLRAGWRSAVWGAFRASFASVDPGLIQLRRGLRGALSFALTVQLARGVSALTGQDPLSMALGFSVSIFGAVAAREAEQRARLISTCFLIAAAGLSFCVSTLITTVWLNHALFIALVFGVVYARRWGDRANATGAGAFSSFFLAALLAPSRAALPWHLLGLLLATLAVFAVLLLLPQRPRAAIERVQRAIARQLDVLRGALGRCALPAGERWQRALRRRVERLETTIRRARIQLDAVTTDSQLRDELGLAFFRLQAAAESLSRETVAATREGEARRASLATAFAEVEGDLRALRGLCADRGFARRATAPPTGAAAAPRAGPDQSGMSLHTRLAIQASVACALAMLAGKWLSAQRWYWAVITVFVMFTGTTSRGDAIYKSLQRLLGTVLGVIAGMGLVSMVGNEPRTLFLLLVVAIFLSYHSLTEHFATMTFFLTIMLALLFALLRRFSEQLLLLRLEETAVGAVAGMLVAALLVPRATHSLARDRFIALLGAVDDLVSAILEQPFEDRATALGARCRAFVQAQDDMSAALGPFRAWPERGGRRVYADVRARLRGCRASLRALLAAAAPETRRFAPSERPGVELLQAGVRRQLSWLGAVARAEDARERTQWPPENPAALERASPRDAAFERMSRALDELMRALSQVAAMIEWVSPPARLRSRRGPATAQL